MSASDYLEDALLNHLFEGSEFTQPTVWVGLSTADPTDDGSGLAEPDTGDEYSRVRPADNTGRWEISEDEGVTSAKNKGVIEFPQAGGDWGTITHVVLFDSETDAGSNNILAVVPVSIPRTIVGGDTVRMGVGSLTVTLD